jgi:uncharacterized protein involved in cysteine biosynthesis
MEGSTGGATTKPHPETGRAETDAERVDRNLLELLNELRVALPGVQVLFAFLLVVPFSQGFANVTPFQKTIYFVTLLCTAAASAFLIGPSMHHRIEFREQDKEHIVLVANRMAIVGLTFMAVAMVGVVMLITDFLYSTTATIVFSALIALAFAVLWYAIPIRRKLSQQ